MIVGTLSAIRRYPVKSLCGESLDAADVTPAGVAGDRERALLVRAGHPRAGKTYRGKENDRLHLADAGSAPGVASGAGVTVELVTGQGDARFFDDAPVSIVFDCWLRDVSAFVGFPVERERFRSNFFVAAVPGFDAAEAELAGRALVVGTVRLRAISPIDRCVTVTYAPDGSGNDPRVLSYLARERNNVMGIYCRVEGPGIVRSGEAVRLDE